VIEFKSADTGDNETPEMAAQKALEQIEEKQYETELVERNIKTIKKLAIVFNGKEIFVKQGKWSVKKPS